MKKILIIIILIFFSINIINAQNIELKWNVKSVTGSGDKCLPLKGSLPVGKIYAKDYAMITMMGDVVNINSCSESTAVVILESNSFKLNSKTATIKMYLPTYSGAKYEIGVDNSNFQLLKTVWMGKHKASQYDCIKNKKLVTNSPSFSTYTIKTDKFLDGKSHMISIKVSKLDTKCPLSLTSKSTLLTSSKSLNPIITSTDSPNSLDEMKTSASGLLNFIDNLFGGSGIKLNSGFIGLECLKGYKKINTVDSQSYCEKIPICDLSSTYEEFTKSEKVELAKKPKGSILKITGRAVIERGIKTYSGKIGSKLYIGDKINVEENSLVSINLDGSGVIKITEKTSFQIPFTQSSKKKISPIKSFFGGLWCRTKILLKGDIFEIKTPTATAGVRG